MDRSSPYTEASAEKFLTTSDSLKSVIRLLAVFLADFDMTTVPSMSVFGTPNFAISLNILLLRGPRSYGYLAPNISTASWREVKI